MSEGGITVTAVITGGYNIDDLQLHVPCRIATYIPADDMLRSKDLYRGLSQRLLFKLDGGSAYTTEALARVPDENLVRISQLEAETRGLKGQLDSSAATNKALQGLLEGLQSQMMGIQQGIERIEAKGISVIGTSVTFSTPPTPSVSTPVTKDDDVVMDVPVFLPKEIKPKGVETQISTESQTVSGASIGAAEGKLRELRKKNSG